MQLFRSVGAHEIPDVWDFVEPGIARILEKCGTQTFTPRDIKRHLFFGRASLFVRDEGFCILEKCQEALSGEPYLNVWLMWFRPGEAEKIEDALIAWLDGMRATHRCMWWEFASPREGWKVMDKHCKRHVQVWRRYQ